MILTHTSMQTARVCLRRYHYRYNLRLVKLQEARALRFGAAMHHAWAQGPQALADTYATVPEFADPYDWEVEFHTAAALFGGYDRHYQDDALQALEIEGAWQMPLVNPETNADSRTWTLAGRRDGIVTYDGRLMVLERKTTGEDVGPDSQYWLRLRIDPQIALYSLAARHDGHDVQAVLYDVIRKPTIKPRQVPELDAEGRKIVRDDSTGQRAMNKNGTPRQTGGEGYTLLARPETAVEYGDRLRADIAERPGYYYARREIPILEDQLRDFRAEMWQLGQMLLTCRNRDLWFRTVGRSTCDYCDYADLCLQSISVNEGVPAGYTRLDDPHPELL